MNIQRYKGHSCFPTIDGTGGYVRYEDYMAVVAKLEAANALLREECEAKQKKIDDAYDSFVLIAEYWNGSDNDRAVADALEVMRNEAIDAAGILKGGTT